MKKGKKLLVALLAVMMVVCMMPAMAFAEDSSDTTRWTGGPDYGTATYNAKDGIYTLKGEPNAYGNGLHSGPYYNPKDSTEESICLYLDPDTLREGKTCYLSVGVTDATIEDPDDAWVNELNLHFQMAGNTPVVNTNADMGNFSMELTDAGWYTLQYEFAKEEGTVYGKVTILLNDEKVGETPEILMGDADVEKIDYVWFYNIDPEGIKVKSAWPHAQVHAVESVIAKSATCTNEGNVAYWYCEDCDKYYTDADLTKEIAKADTVVAKLAHNFKDGKCTVCQAADPNFKPAEPEIVAPEVDPEKPVEEVTVGVVVEKETEDMLIESAGKEVQEIVKTALDEGKKVVTEVAVAKVDVTKADEATKKDIAKVEALVKESKLEVAQYLDLSVLIKVDGTTVGEVEKLNKPLTFQIAVPEDLQKEGRIFTVIRVHDGKAEELKTTVKDGVITFETDRFSTYALTYTDKASATPETGDMNNMLPWMAAMAIAAVGAVALKKKED